MFKREVYIMLGKKGDISTIFIFIVFMTILAIFFLIFSYMFQTTSSALANTPLNSTAGSMLGITTMSTSGASSFQQVYLFVLGFFIVGMMVTAYLVPTHPIAIPVYIFAVALSVITAVVLSNGYQATNVGVLSTVYSQQIIIKTIMENLVAIATISAGISMFVMFARIKFLGVDGGL